MKRKNRKLSLNRSTLRNLQRDQLDNAAGGKLGAGNTAWRCSSQNSTLDINRGFNGGCTQA